MTTRTPDLGSRLNDISQQFDEALEEVCVVDIAASLRPSASFRADSSSPTLIESRSSKYGAAVCAP